MSRAEKWARVSSLAYLLRGAIRRETAGGAEDSRRLREVFLPQQRSHRDLQRTVLYRQLINIVGIRRMIVNGPPRCSEHKVARFPLVPLPFDDAPAAALEEIIDCRCSVPVWTIDNIRRTQTNRRKKSV